MTEQDINGLRMTIVEKFRCDLLLKIRHPSLSSDEKPKRRTFGAEVKMLHFTVPLYTWMLFVLSKNQANPLKQETCTNPVSARIVRHPFPVGRSLETSVRTKTSPFS